MSIILGPYENEGKAVSEREDDDELFVFGYASKFFRDDSKAILENSGQLLIPWMGDGSLMVDRYDIRNRLEDKGQFGLKSILPRRMTQAEEEADEALDHERYLALGVDVLEHELMEEEAKKRARESDGHTSYRAVGFAYKEKTPTSEATPTPAPAPPRPEYPPTSSVDVVENEEDPFVMPEGLVVPGHTRMPATSKLHSIIERTAGFVAHQGTQMEIIIKAKQKYNPFFSFVSPYDPLHAYYRYLLQVISSGEYVPKLQVEKTGTETEHIEGGASDGGDGREGDVCDGETGEVEETAIDDDASASEEEDSDDGGFELHPLLRVSTTPRSSPKPRDAKNPPNPPTTSTSDTALSTATATTLSTSLRHPPPPSSSSASFYTQSRGVNAAPSLDRVPAGQPVYPCPHPSAESQQAVPPEGQTYHSHYQYTDGYGYQPHAADYSNQYSLEAYYHRLSAQHISSKMVAGEAPPPPPPGGHSVGPPPPPPGGHSVGPPPPPPSHNAGPPPPPPDLQPIIDKTAEYVARNSEDFEHTVLEKHCGDPKFGFLNPWNKYYPYYKLKLQLNKEKAVEEALAAIEEDLWRKQKEETLKGKKIQKLSESGTVSFKMEAKKTATVLEIATVDLSPAEEEEEKEKEGPEQDVKQEESGEWVGEGGGYEPVTPPDVNYTAQDGYQTGQDGYQVTQDEHDYRAGQEMGGYQTTQDCDQPYLESCDVHYSAEGKYYYPSNGEEVESPQRYGEEPPPAKRAKTTSKANTIVMDNKVQEFLSQVKAVLDT